MYPSSRYDNSGICSTAEGRKKAAQQLARKGPFPGPDGSGTASDSSSSDSDPQAILQTKSEKVPATKGSSSEVVAMDVEIEAIQQEEEDTSHPPEPGAKAGPGPSTQAMRKSLKNARSPSISPGTQSMI